MSVTLHGKKGTYVFDPFSENSKLGEGGMGLVYLGEESNSSRKVAIKVLYKELSSNPVNIKRALKESNISFDHRNILKMIEFVEMDKIYHIISEYLDGESLDTYIEKQKNIPQEKSIQIVCEVLQGLTILHNAKPPIVHRDIKPSNIFLCNNGDIKIMDFGVARSLENTNNRLTKTGSVVGTPYYAAPEQIRSQTELINPTTDIYSLGVTLYELLTGAVPFEGKSEYDTLKMQVEKPLPPHHKISPSLFRVIAKATAKNQQERFKNSREFLTALEPFRPKIPNQGSTKQPRVKSQSGTAKVFNWIFIPLALILGVALIINVIELQIVREEASNTYSLYYNLINMNTNLTNENANLSESLSFFSEKTPIIITGTPLRFLDKDRNILNDFPDALDGGGGKNYRYIEPKVFFNSLVQDSKILLIYYKIYLPRGGLLYNSKYVNENPIEPKALYTNYYRGTFSRGQKGEFLMHRFGTNFYPGTYKLEIWYGNNRLYRRDFKVN
jgi:serine/threonine protein kinase